MSDKSTEEAIEFLENHLPDLKGSISWSLVKGAALQRDSYLNQLVLSNKQNAQYRRNQQTLTNALGLFGGLRADLNSAISKANLISNDLCKIKREK